MTSTARRAILASTSVVLGLSGTVLAAHAAHASTTQTTQLAAVCQQTSDGRACLGLNRTTGSGTSYTAVFTLTPAAGHVMRPVSWQPINPGFYLGDRSVCSSTCNVVSKPWVKTIGNMSVESVIRFTYYTPGASHQISVGQASYTALTRSGNVALRENTEYNSANNVIGSMTNTEWYGGYPYGPQQPAYVRIFDSLNRTLASGRLCPLDNTNTGSCVGPQNLSQVGVYGTSSAQGSAGLLPTSPGHTVTLTAENKEFRTK